MSGEAHFHAGTLNTHVFDAAIALQPLRENVFRGCTSPAYRNMVGPYGGITAAQALNAVLLHPERLGHPVALTVNYAAAIADGPFDVVARPARTNRSTQHWTLEFVQAGQTVLTGTALFGLRRETWGADEQTMPEVALPAEYPVQQWDRPGVKWLSCYELRFVDGGIPPVWNGQDQGESRTRLWMRDDPPRPLDFAALTALADVFFPRVWRRRPLMVPVGTVSMTVYFHADAAMLRATGSDYVLGQAQAQSLRGGYFDQTAQMWNRAGRLLATTHQMVYYKE